MTGHPWADAIILAAAVVTAAGVILGALWRIVRPKVRDELRALLQPAREAAEATRDALDEGRQGSVGHHAAEAAKAAHQVPALRQQLKELDRRLGPLVDANLVERLTLVEVAQGLNETRLSAVEQAVIQQIATRFYPPDQRRRHDPPEET